MIVDPEYKEFTIAMKPPYFFPGEITVSVVVGCERNGS